MDVYLVPAGRGRFELYSESPDHAGPDADVHAPRGAWQRLVDRFRTVLSSIERAQEERESASKGPSLPPSRSQRLKARLLRWLAERVAEQRLLWHLRGQTRARLVCPADIDPSRADHLLRAILKRDADRHLAWLSANAVAFVASGLIAPLPGPNMIAYYFAFRLVGHYLSMRGARHGLSAVRWSVEPSEALAELGRLCGLPPPERADGVRAVAAALGLERLPRFFGRVASPVC